MPKTPQQAAQMWADKMATSGDKYKAGIDAVTENPADKAAAAQDRWIAGVQQSASNGKWRRGLAKSTLSSWKDKAKTKGADRLASGARDAKPKMEKFLTAWLPVAADIKATVASMPKGGIEASLARVRVAMEKAKQFKDGGGAG